ncbi:MAG: circadian clock protein KaiC [bacterium]
MEKAPTGIVGLDAITGGGFPKGRPTLICGGAGSGKTLLGMLFLVRGAVQYGEPGVYVSFEETPQELTQNVASLGYDLTKLTAQKKIILDHVVVERLELQPAGEYDLEGLFIRLGSAIDAIGAKRVVLDTLEVLFSALPNPTLLRAELGRLFRWLKAKGVTAVVTAERGDGRLTRQGLEEYVADCVIVLDHRVADQVSTHRLRIVKYRGTAHGTNEYPFLIGRDGLTLLPVTGIQPAYAASTGRISTGVERLDAMLEGRGYYRGSTVLISGSAGCGKTSLGAAFAEATCRRGERVLFFAMEESEDQIVRNMRSIGMDLAPWVRKGRLRFHVSRPALFGLEAHLMAMLDTVVATRPSVVILDPVTNFLSAGTKGDASAMLVRLIDFLKEQQITAFFTDLSPEQDGEYSGRQSEGVITSMIDTWILLRNLETNGERTRGLYIIKSRGMAHSNQIREMLLTDSGIQLVDVYVGVGAALTGSARVIAEARERADEVVRARSVTQKRSEIKRNRAALEAQIAALRAEVRAQEDALTDVGAVQAGLEQAGRDERAGIGLMRIAAAPRNSNGGRGIGRNGK